MKGGYGPVAKGYELVDVRRKAIGLLKEGKGAAEIAKQLGLKRGTVQTWKRREGLVHKKGPTLPNQ